MCTSIYAIPTLSYVTDNSFYLFSPGLGCARIATLPRTCIVQLLASLFFERGLRRPNFWGA